MEEFATMEIEMPLISTAAIKVAIFLWYHVDVSEFTKLKREKMNEVIRNVQALPLPEYLQRKVLSVIQPIGIYLQKSFLFMHCIIVPVRSCNTRWPIGLNWPKLLCWKNIGVLDNRRTAEKIINSGVLDTISVFRLACFNCIENEIDKLWCDSNRQLHRHFRVLFNHESLEVIFWLSKLKREINLLMMEFHRLPNRTLPAAEYGFGWGIRVENIEFCKYFARRLESWKLNSFMVTASRKFLNQTILDFQSDAFRLVFSHLNLEQKVQIFTVNPLKKLIHLLSWPLQDFFLEIAIKLYDYLSESDFLILLHYICLCIGRYKYSYQIWEYIFQTFWGKSPLRLKSYVLMKWIHEKMLVFVFRSEEFETRLGVSDIEEKLSEIMISNGLVVLEVLLGFCYLDSLEIIFERYMFTEPFANEFRRTISDLRSSHMCNILCYPHRFNEQIMFLNVEIADLIYEALT